MHRIDADAHVAHAFSDGDPGIGQPGTRMDAAWANAVQEEIAGFIESRGLVLTKGDHTQLAAAIATYFPAVAWTALAPNSDWSTAGGGLAAAYWVDAAGVVHLRGQLTAGASAVTLMAGGLPVGLRPAADRRFALAMNNDAFQVVQVAADGTIYHNGTMALGDYVRLDGISFVAEQ